MKKNFKFLKRIVFVFVWFLTSVTFFGLIHTSIETIEINMALDAFVKNGILDEEKSTDEIKYYKIPSSEQKEAFTYDNKDKLYLGSSGDILVAMGSPYEEIPFVNEFISFFFGRHAAIVAEDYEGKSGYNGKDIFTSKTDVIETTGLAEDPLDNCITYQKNDFIYYDTVIGLRPKEAEKEDYKKVFEYCYTNMYKLYNFTFIFQTKNKYYCTDIVSRAFAYAGFDLNKDYIATTANDLVTSDDTYIFLYKYLDKGIQYIYYLDTQKE